jgi:hypothetical protein
MVTGLPSGSPNLSMSAPSLSPVCSSEDGGRAVSPLPARLGGGPVNLSDPRGSPPGESASSGRLSHHQQHLAAGGLDPSHFLGGEHNAGSSPAAAAAAAAAGLSLAYPRLSGMGMAALGSMPSLSYASGEQNPYSSLSMENFYNPLVSVHYRLALSGIVPNEGILIVFLIGCLSFCAGKSIQFKGERRRRAGYVGLEQLEPGRLGGRLLPVRHVLPGGLRLRRCLRPGRH